MHAEEQERRKISSSRKLTPDEQAVLRVVAESRGWDFVDQNEVAILDAARAIGDLPQEPEEDAAGYDPGHRPAGLVPDETDDEAIFRWLAGLVPGETDDEAILRRMNEDEVILRWRRRNQWSSCPRRACDGGPDEAPVSSCYLVKARPGEESCDGGQGEAEQMT
jgi:hypothetical protein